MTRIDRQYFDAARFPVRFEVPTRFDDVDMQGHVNNAAAVVFLQEARAHFNVTAGVANLRGSLRPMVAALTVEYASEMHHPGIVTIDSGVLEIGRSSVTFGQVARLGGRARLYARAVMVFADTDGAAPIPDDMRAAYANLMIADGRT